VHSKKREISKYGYIVFASLIITSIFNYLYQVIMGNLLSRSEFGILGLALSTFFIVSVLLQNTFTWSGTRYMASKPELTAHIFNAVLAGNLTLATLLSIAVLGISRASSFFGMSVLISATLIIGALLATLNTYIRAYKFFTNMAFANIINSITKLVSSVALVLAGYKAAGAFFGVLIGMIVALVYLTKAVGAKISGKPTINLNTVKILLKESIFVALIFTGITIIVNFNIIILKLVNLSNSIIGNFNAALTVARGIFFLSSAIVPVVFSYTSSKDPNREVYAVKMLRYIIIFVFPVVVTMYINPEIWLSLFFGSKYLASSEVLRLLAVGIGFTSLSFAALSNLVAFEDYRVPALFVAVSVTVMCVYSTFNRTSVGVATAVAISALVLTFTTLPYYGKKYKIRVKTSSCFKVASANLVFLLTVMGPKSRVSAFALLCITYIIYVLVLIVTRELSESDVETIIAPMPEGIRRRVLLVCRYSRKEK